MPRQRATGMVTIRDIARESGFSIGTVSIVLNDAPLARYMSPNTKQHIKEVAQRLGYSPNQFARSLRGSRSHTVGVMVIDVTDPFCTSILRGIESSLYKASYLSIFADAQNDLGRFERYLEMMLERRVEALIVIANWMLVDITLLSDLEKHRIPTVIVARELQADCVSSVLVDNQAGARMAIEHLYELGHRDIAFIRGPKAIGDIELRWNGIRSFARSAHLKLDPKLILEMPPIVDTNHTFEVAQKLTEELIKHKRHFSALMAYDDIAALGAMRALTKAGLRIPDQCSVVGFDDVAPAALASPPLTTIRQPMETMGSAAVEIVTSAIKAGLEKREFSTSHRKLMPELVVRQSTVRPE
ncbi:MAG TPA: LacI family DNA-binding transcriptional regulator [Terriglobales bacterium]|nr:LacI family DNA-binding transcriptional regulator [Terriglobales bacterium]